MDTLTTQPAVGDAACTKGAGAGGSSPALDPARICLKCKQALERDCVIEATVPKKVQGSADQKLLIYCPLCTVRLRVYLKHDAGDVRIVLAELIDPTEEEARVLTANREARLANPNEDILAWS